MQAYRHRPTGQMELVALPEPTLCAGDVLAEVVSAGICGTDLKIARGEHRLFPPGTDRTPGHEMVVRVLEGETDDGLAAGQLAAVAPNIACGRCPACRSGRGNLCAEYESIGLTMDGAFAEHVLVPTAAVGQGNLLPLPAGLDPDLAVLMEPIAAVLRGVDAIELWSADTLVIAGAGPIGLIALLLARLRGVARVVVSQPSEGRRELARQLGADEVIDPRASDVVKEVLRVTDGRGADAVMVTTPVPEVFAQSLELAAVGGRINFFAGLPASAGRIPLEANLVHYRELTVTGSTANTTDDCRRALELLAEHPGTFAPLVTHHFDLRAADQAFAEAKGGHALKVVIQP
jgi:L-iditol 2-dehydrogenase